jgi:hypothetical protein
MDRSGNSELALGNDGRAQASWRKTVDIQGNSEFPFRVFRTFSLISRLKIPGKNVRNCSLKRFTRFVASRHDCA